MLDGSQSMGVHLTLSGVALAALREAGLTDRALCQYAVDNNGKLARLDTAINIHGGKLTINDIEQAYRLKRAKTRASHGLRFTGLMTANDGLTLGSRTSDRYFRAYDKRAETGTVGDTWVRFELETKHKPAQNIALAVASQENTRAVINKSIKTYLDLPDLPEYVQALADDDATIERVPHKLSATLTWLIEQVVPAMDNYELEHPNVDTLAIVVSALSQRREQRNEVDAR
jgi:DNA relaxase NicK